MEYNNVLNNPTLTGHTIKQEWLKDGNKLYIEWPDAWEFETNLASEKRPQLLHKDPSGCAMHYGWITHISSLIQRKVRVRNERYLLKAIIRVHRGFTDANTFSPSNIEWRFEVAGLSYSNVAVQRERAIQTWNSTVNFGAEINVLFPFQCTGDGLIDVYFTMQSNYPTHTCTFEILSLQLLEVEPTYGNPNVAFIQPLALPQPEPPAPAPDPEPQPPIETPEPPQPPVDNPPSQWNLPLNDWLALLQIHAHSHRDAAKHHRRLAANHFQTADLIDRMIIKFGGTPEPKEDMNSELASK